MEDLWKRDWLSVGRKDASGLRPIGGIGGEVGHGEP